MRCILGGNLVYLAPSRAKPNLVVQSCYIPVINNPSKKSIASRYGGITNSISNVSLGYSFSSSESETSSKRSCSELSTKIYLSEL